MGAVISGNGYGYMNKDGCQCMVKCFQCGRENYGPTVATGHCAWCGYNPNKVPADLEATPKRRIKKCKK